MHWIFRSLICISVALVIPLQASGQIAEQSPEANRPKHIDPSIWDRIVYVFRAQSDRNAPVRIVGRVVDPDGRGVGGVRVSGSVTTYSSNILDLLGMEGDDLVTSPWVRETDEDGRFVVDEISGFGARISGVEAESHVFSVRDKNQLVDLGPMDAKNMLIRTGAVSIIAWPKTLVQEAGRLIVFKKRVIGEGDRQTHFIDTISGTIADAEPPIWDYSITVQVDTESVHDNRFDWRVAVTANKGAVVLGGGGDMFMAPLHGYTNKIVMTNASSDDGWSLFETLQFYYRRDDHAVYAANEVGIYPDSDGSYIMRMTSTVNTNGSPNLLTLKPR